MIHQRFSKPRVRVFLVCMFVAGFLAPSEQAFSQRGGEESSPTPEARPAKPDASVALASPVRDPLLPVLSAEEQASQDPYGYLEAALQNYDHNVRDYTCTFTKRELLGSGLSQEQVMRAMFREQPYSVRLEWVKNADRCSRVLYVVDKWVEDGQQMAVVEPSGAIARFFVSYVMRPIHGGEASKSSRKAIDQFGMRNSLALTLKFARLAKERNILQLEYKGKGSIDNRETLVFERRLPYTQGDTLWPDRVLVVHIDKEYRLPTLCESYSDDARKHLLGRYMVTNVKLNANLPDSIFTTQGMGLD